MKHHKRTCSKKNWKKTILRINEDSHCIEEEHFQDIANETIILNVEKEEKNECFQEINFSFD
jgi:hypothetical protein